MYGKIGNETMTEKKKLWKIQKADELNTKLWIVAHIQSGTTNIFICANTTLAE